MGTVVLSQGQSGRVVKLTTDHLVQRLRMSETVPLLASYAIIAQTGTAIRLVGPYILFEMLLLTAMKLSKNHAKDVFRRL